MVEASLTPVTVTRTLFDDEVFSVSDAEILNVLDPLKSPTEEMFTMLLVITIEIFEPPLTVKVNESLLKSLKKSTRSNESLNPPSKIVTSGIIEEFSGSQLTWVKVDEAEFELKFLSN